jgi:hypothetical protein
MFVNYNRERNELAGAAIPVAAGQPATTFVKGPEESGKTELLQWFRTAHGAANQVCYIDVADPAAATTPRAVMSTFITDLADPTFDDYWIEDRKVTTSVATIQNVSVEGNYNQLNALTGVAVEDQLANLIPLTRAFVLGVAAASAPSRPIVLCVDGYSSTEKLTRLWIRRQLVRMMQPLPFARLVITGREAPDRDLLIADQSLHLIELGGIHDVGEWLLAAQALGCPLPPDPAQAVAGLTMVVEYADGKPGGIMSYLRRKAGAKDDR